MDPLLSELSSDLDLGSVGGLYPAGGGCLPLVLPHPASLERAHHGECKSRIYF